MPNKIEYDVCLGCEMGAAPDSPEHSCPCGTCGGSGKVLKDHVSSMFPDKDRAYKPCPNCGKP